MTIQTKPACQERVPQSPGSYLFRDCGITASFHEADPARPGDGGKLKWYCRRHAPSIVSTKHATRNAAWDAKWAAERAEAEAKQRQQAENSRKLLAYPALVAACRAAMLERGLRSAVQEQLRNALAAAGESDEPPKVTLWDSLHHGTIRKEP